MKDEAGIDRPRHHALAPQARGPGARSTARPASDLGVPVGTDRRHASASSSAACRSPTSATATSSTTSGSAPTAQDRGATQDLYDLTLPSPTAGLVKLASVAQLDDETGPDRDRAAQPRADRHRPRQPRRHRRWASAVSRADSDPQGDGPAAAATATTFSGQAKTLGETGYYFLIAFVLSIVFMYLILAAQFESWMQPIAILMALPVTIPFGLLSLVLFRTPMDLYAMFGLFMLVGIVKKNGILQVDATNQLRARGHATARRRSSRPTTPGCGRS